MKQLLYLFLFLLMSNIELLAQPTGFNNSYHIDSFSTAPYFSTIFNGVEVSDTAYYLIGMCLDSNTQQQAVNFPWHTTGCFIQMNTDGEIINNHLIKEDSTVIELKYNPFIKTKDGHLLYAGAKGQNTVLYKVNDQGNILWKKEYGGDSLDYFSPYKVIIAKNNGYFLLIRTLDGTPNTQNLMRGTVIKIDSLGDELWRTKYVPMGFEQSADSKLIEIGKKIVLMGIRADGHSQVDYNYKAQTQIRKIDSTGNIVGEYITANNRRIGMWDGIQTQDGGFAFCGVEGTQITVGGGPSMIYRNYVAKVDSNFQLVWEKGFGQPDPLSYLKDIEELSDGSLVLVGRRNIFFPEGANYEVADSGYGMACILKLSAAGDSLWQRLYRKPFTNRNFLNDIEVLPDGGFLAAGYTEQYSTVTFNYDYWGLLIRMDSLGCVVPGCELLDNTTNKAIDFDNEVTVFPNPASAIVNFKFEQPIAAAVVIRVYSTLGQLVGEASSINKVDNLQMNVSDWHQGVYYYGIYQNGQLVMQGQILKQ